MKPRIVTASIGPIQAKNIRFPASVFEAEVRIEVDPKHPITVALSQQLPRLDDLGLQALKNHMVRQNGQTNSMSRKDDVESWIAMVDQEINYRKKEQMDALTSLLSFLSS